MPRLQQSILTAMLLAASAGLEARPAPPLDTARLEELTGQKGKLDEKEGVFKVSLPRTDIAATADGVRLTPALGLTAWAAFQRAGHDTMVMGDMVLLEDQVTPVMDVALANGLDVTALHEHFLRETPRVMFMHVAGMGDEETLAQAVGKLFAAMKETGGGHVTPEATSVDPAATTLDPKRIEAILGTGDFKDGVFKVVIGRTTSMGGHVVGKTMGVNTWAAFAGSDQAAVVCGDFALKESELRGVLLALRRAGIEVVAIHQHMAGERPRILFLHYWGRGSTDALARGVRAGLDVTQARPAMERHG